MKKQCIICQVQNCSLAETDSLSDCPIHKFLHVLGGKWGMIVLSVLVQPHRYGELKKTIAEITEKMLITTLHDLEKAGYLSKQKTSGKLLQSTYTITPLGKNALEIGLAMAEMGKLL